MENDGDEEGASDEGTQALRIAPLPPMPAAVPDGRVEELERELAETKEALSDARAEHERALAEFRSAHDEALRETRTAARLYPTGTSRLRVTDRSPTAVAQPIKPMPSAIGPAAGPHV